MTGTNNSFKDIRVGIVGACGRGASFRTACDALPQISIEAVCDVNTDELADARQRLGAKEQYEDYASMLESADIDAVIIGTPMHLHVPMSITALKRDIHVLCEVPAGVSVKECRDLVKTWQTSDGIYMMAENYTYMRPNVIVRQMVQEGLFGTPYYAEGEYLHELKHMNEYDTPWRRRWQTGIDGITYGTHSLGPILQWMPGDRVERVCCEGTGVRHKDHTGEPYCQASSTMLAKTEKDALIKIRVDMLSDRPHAMTNYQLQGTDGCYESSRAYGEKNRVWLRSGAEDTNVWMELEEMEEECLPDFWKEHMDNAQQAGHGGGDYFEILDFVRAINGSQPCPVGIHEAMDMTLPGLISQQSIQSNGKWMPVPDSRNWCGETDR